MIGNTKVKELFILLQRYVNRLYAKGEDKNIEKRLKEEFFILKLKNDYSDSRPTIMLGKIELLLNQLSIIETDVSIMDLHFDVKQSISHNNKEMLELEQASLLL